LLCLTGLVEVKLKPMSDAGPEVVFIIPPAYGLCIADPTRCSFRKLGGSELQMVHLPESIPKIEDVVLVSGLMRELVWALTRADHTLLPAARTRLLRDLLLDEIAQAAKVPLWVRFPSHVSAHPLRSLCGRIARSELRDLSAASCARVLGVTERTLSRQFHLELGVPFAQWRRAVVVSHAIRLLAAGESIKSVARESGYASASAFSAMFRTAVGRPALELKRALACSRSAILRTGSRPFAESAYSP
jgi:AraC-like DNA-binding protein